MADVTRFKDLQEAQKKLDQLLQTEAMKRAASEMKVNEQFQGMDKKFEHLTNTLADIQLQLLNLNSDNGLGDNSVLGTYGKGNGSGRNGSITNFALSPLPRLDFPRFEGSNPRSWIIKCNSYFKLMPGIPDSQKVHLASMHFEGKALTWFQNLNMGDVAITWEQFLEVVSARFEDLRVSNIIVEFNKLKMTDSYDAYVEHFNELKACMVMNDNSKYSEDYFMASFLSGLSEELRSFIHMFQPRTLDQTIELGRQQIVTLDAIAKRVNPSPRSLSHQGFGKSEGNQNHIPAKISSNSIPTKLLTSAEMTARREKGLCYNCDEPYVFGHRCKHRVNYLMMTEAEEIMITHADREHGLRDEEGNMLQHIEEVHMSLHSIMGANGITTMRVVGEIGDHKLNILLDTGSTLSFLKEETAQKLGCAVQADRPLLVKVANGQKLISSKKATDFTWTVQGHEFQFSPRLLKNEGCDMILGGDWFRVYSPIEFDYSTMQFIVSLNGERVKLQALTTGVDCKFITETVLTSLHHEELPYFDDKFVAEADAANTNSPVTLGLLIGCSDISTTSEERGEKQLRIGDLVLLKFHPLHQSSFYGSNDIIPVLGPLEDVVAASHMITPFLVLGFPSGLLFVADTDTALRCCTKYKSGQKLLEAVGEVTRNCKIEPLFVLNTHSVLQKRQEILQMLQSRLKIGPPFTICASFHHIIIKFSFFDPWGQGSIHRGGIVMDWDGLKGNGVLGKKKGKEDLGFSIEIETGIEMVKGLKAKNVEEKGLGR